MIIKTLKRLLGVILSICLYSLIVYLYASPHVTVGKYILLFFAIPVIFAIFIGLMRLIGWLFK
jgi:hypothetical protein